MRPREFFEELLKLKSIEKVLESHPDLSWKDVDYFFSKVIDRLSESKDASQRALDSGFIYEMFVDGASSGNPGKAGIGIVIKKEGLVIKEVSESIGLSTNNVAEYTALLRGLELLKREGAESAKVFSDSELIVKQVRGEYRVNNSELKKLHKKVLDLIRDFANIEIIHIGREYNSLADKLAKKACF